MPRQPAWKAEEHDVELTWQGPLDYPDLVADRLSDSDREFFDEYAGLYFWRAKTGIFARQNLYVGQTFQGLLQRTRQHLQTDLGRKLQTIHAEGTLAYLWGAAIRYAPERARIPEQLSKALFDTIERALILHLRPLWNTAGRAAAVIPLNVIVTSVGDLPPEIRRSMRIHAGEYFLKP